MADNRVEKAVGLSSPRLYNLVLWLAFFGMVIALSRIVFEEQKIDQLQHDFHLLRLQSQQEISDVRSAQSALLEQDLLRLDQLSTQLTKTNQDVLDQAKTLANRTKSDLAKTVEQRHQEMIRAISDVRSDIRPGTNANATAPAREAPIVSAEVQAGSGEVDAVNSSTANRSSSSATVASSDAHEDPPPAPSPKKKRFWERLNPFGRKKQEAGSNGL